MPWWQILALVAVLGWLYASVLRHLVWQWAHDPNYSHGFFVPLFSLFVIWSEREKLRNLAGNRPGQGCWFDYSDLRSSPQAVSEPNSFSPGFHSW